MASKKVNQLLQALAAVALIGAGSQAFAQTCPETNDPGANYRCVFLNVGAAGTGDGVTGSFYELGITGTLATSIYSTPTIGASIIDTNISSVLSSFGIATGTYQSLAEVLGGGPLPDVFISDTATPGQKNVDSLNPLASGLDDTEGFNSGGGWGLYFNYQINGTLTAAGPVYNSGFFDIFFDDFDNGANDNKKVLRIDVTGSNIAAANLDLLGVVDFSSASAPNLADPFVAAFWNFQTGFPNAWADLFAADPLIAIRFALDTNVNPPIPTADRLVPFTDAQGVTRFVRQTTLDSSVRFNVPEPSSLALGGLVLVAAGLFQRRRQKTRKS